MSQIYVEHARIEAAANQLRAHKNSFDHVLGQLETDLAPMIASWSGEAQELYLTKKRTWDTAAADLSAVLATIAQLTENAHGGYVRTVNNVKEMWT